VTSETRKYRNFRTSYTFMKARAVVKERLKFT